MSSEGTETAGRVLGWSSGTARSPSSFRWVEPFLLPGLLLVVWVATTSALRLFHQEAGEFVAIKPLPVVPQRDQELEFTVCEDHHRNGSSDCDNS